MNITVHRFILLGVGTIFAVIGLMLWLIMPYRWWIFVPMALLGIAALAVAFLARDEVCERIIVRIKESVIELANRARAAVERLRRRR